MSAALAMLVGLVWGASDFIVGTVSRRADPILVVGFAQSIGLVMCIIWASADGGFAHPGNYLAMGLVIGVVSFIGFITFSTAMTIGRMGVVAPISSAGAVLPIGYALVIGQRPGAVALCGVVVALVGVVLASGPEFGTHAGPRVVGLSLVSAVSYGTMLILFSRAGNHPAQTLFAARLAGALLITGYILRRRPVMPRLPVDRAMILFIGVADTSALALYEFASRTTNLSVVAILSSLYPVYTVILARQFHDEHIRGVQAVGVVAAIVGIVLIGAG